MIQTYRRSRAEEIKSKSRSDFRTSYFLPHTSYLKRAPRGALFLRNLKLAVTET